jgi:hypothetical protein
MCTVPYLGDFVVGGEVRGGWFCGSGQGLAALHAKLAGRQRDLAALRAAKLRRTAALDAEFRSVRVLELTLRAFHGSFPLDERAQLSRSTLHCEDRQSEVTNAGP